MERDQVARERLHRRHGLLFYFFVRLSKLRAADVRAAQKNFVPQQRERVRTVNAPFFNPHARPAG